MFMRRSTPMAARILGLTGSTKVSPMLGLASQQRSFATIKKFTETHEWIELDTETKVATIGVTDHAQGELGEVVYVELPEAGTEFVKSDIIATVESTKTAADIYQMVDGEVIEVNEALKDDPSLVNSSAEEGGWMMKISVTDESQFDSLLSLEDYEKIAN